MAVVKGVKEKVHLPLYDSVSVKGGKRLGEILTSNVLRFFLDVTGKTKLQTNMQAAALLPHWNTFEARALRVVISDLTAQLPDTPAISLQFPVFLIPNFTIVKEGGANAPQKVVTVTNLNLTHFVDFKRRIEGAGAKQIELNADDLEALKLTLGTGQTLGDKEVIIIDRGALKQAEQEFEKLGRVIPPPEQIFPNDGFGTLIGKFIYNTVTTFFVGEKIMIQVPTWFFPAGAGPYSENGRVTTHGYPNPQATFRFAEPVMIDAQQNFRVEIEVPESEVLSDLQRLYGPLFVWVALDGYMTRDVQ